MHPTTLLAPALRLASPALTATSRASTCAPTSRRSPALLHSALRDLDTNAPAWSAVRATQMPAIHFTAPSAYVAARGKG